MKKTFYSHLIKAQIIEEELETLDLTQTEKDELLHHVHGSIHYTVLDVTLDSLPEEHKKKFLEHVNQENHEKAWEHLLEHAVGVEEKIKNSAEGLIQGFLDDIHKVKAKA